MTFLEGRLLPLADVRPDYYCPGWHPNEYEPNTPPTLSAGTSPRNKHCENRDS